ncbi:hypothetical protein GCM10010360_09000 [Streptomyces nogalater]
MAMVVRIFSITNRRFQSGEPDGTLPLNEDGRARGKAAPGSAHRGSLMPLTPHVSPDRRAPNAVTTAGAGP